MDIDAIRPELDGYRDIFERMGIEKLRHPDNAPYCGDLERLFAHYYAVLDDIEQILVTGEDRENACILLGAVRAFMFEHGPLTFSQVEECEEPVRI